MKKELKFILIAIIFIIVVVGILVGVVCGVNYRNNPPVKLQNVVVNVRDNKAVLTEGQSSEKDLRSAITVVAKYSNGTSEIVKDYLVLNFDSSKIGTQTATIEYKGKRAEVTVEIIKPTPPLTEDDVIGSYDAEFYQGDATIDIIKNKTYNLNLGNRVITGSYEIVDVNNLTLMMNNHPLKVVINRDENKLSWYDITEGVGLRRSYTHSSQNGQNYCIFLYDNQIIKWASAPKGEEFVFFAYGGYYYDNDGNFVAYCYDEEYIFVLDNENSTFDLKKDKPIYQGQNFYCEQTSDDFLYRYTLNVSEDGYTLKTDVIQNEVVLRSNTEAGKCSLENNVLSFAEDAEKRKAILDESNQSFEFAYIIYSTLHSPSKDISYRLTLIDKGSSFAYQIHDVSLPIEMVELYNGTLPKTNFVNGFINLGNEASPCWGYYQQNQVFVLTEAISGTYYLKTELKTTLVLNTDGTYALTYKQGGFEEGTYLIQNGRVVVDGKFVNFEERQFSFDENNILKAECSLPTKFLLNDVVDINSANLTIDSISGEHLFIRLDQAEITNLSTSQTGRFVAFIRFGDYLYRHIYEVYDSENVISIIVNNFPSTVKANSGLDVLEGISVYAQTNLGNEIYVDRALVEIENFVTDIAGTHVCTIRYQDLSLEVSYEVSAEQIETRISLHGIVTKYNQNDPLNLDGAYLKVYFNYGNDISVPVTEDMVSGFDTSIKGTFVAKISYKGFSVNYSYEVSPIFEINTIKLGEWLEISATNQMEYENMAKVAFTPAESGEYVFTSESFWDSLGYLYNDKIERLAFDDDSGENMGFKIVYSLEADKTYYLAVRITGEDGKVRLLVTKNGSNNESEEIEENE